MTIAAQPVRTAPLRSGPVRRRRPHTTYPRLLTAPPSLRPGRSAADQGTGGAPHRARLDHPRCDDRRTAARAAALRRRHILLAVVAVAVLLALAVPWGTRGDPGLSGPRATPAATGFSPPTVSVVQPGDPRN